MEYDLPDQAPPDEGIDEELVLIFLTNYHALERALVGAGFARAGRTPGSSRPDWDGFARHIEGTFQPDSSPELMGAIEYLIADPVKHELRLKRIQDAYLGEPSRPESDLYWLTELIQEIGNKLSHWINFMGEPAFGDTDVLAALFVIQAWSYLDPKVESLLRYVQ